MNSGVTTKAIALCFLCAAFISYNGQDTSALYEPIDSNPLAYQQSAQNWTIERNNTIGLSEYEQEPREDVYTPGSSPKSLGKIFLIQARCTFLTLSLIHI